MARQSKGPNYGDGGIRQDADGYFTAWLYIGKTLTRRRRSTIEAAETAYQELITLRGANVNVAQGAQAFRGYATYWFNEVYMQRDNSERSIRDCRDTIERYILPAIGTRRVMEIQHAELQQLLNNLRRRPKPLKPLSASVIQHVKSVLVQIFTKATSERLTRDNPALGLQAPKIKRPKKEAPTPEQVRRLLSTVEAHPTATVYHVMATLGTRLGETLALRRTDCNADFSEITIATAINYQTNKHSTPKDDSGRKLPVPPALQARLRAQWERVKPERDWGAMGLLFPSEAGTIKQPGNLEKEWGGYLFRRKTKNGTKEYTYPGWREKAGLPDDMVMHDFRKFVATTLEGLLVDQRIIGHILGHGAKNVTELYMLRHEASMRRALEMLEGELWGMEETQEGHGNGR